MLLDSPRPQATVRQSEALLSRIALAVAASLQNHSSPYHKPQALLS